jgi:hypothetical protein
MSPEESPVSDCGRPWTPHPAKANNTGKSVRFHTAVIEVKKAWSFEPLIPAQARLPPSAVAPVVKNIGLALQMSTKLGGIQLWQRNLASLIRSGLFQRADTGELNGLHTVVGIRRGRFLRSRA